jgi:putative ABC transport system substrate-binding protein
LLLGPTEEDKPTSDNISAFREGLAKLGWVEQRNLRMDLRFGGGEAGRIRAGAAELVSLAPDVIVTSSGAATIEVQRQTQTIPIIITGAGDTGIVKNISRPEGNITGITNLYASIFGKWTELLKQVSPGIERIGLVYNSQLSGRTSLPVIQDAARALSVKAIDIPFQDPVDLVDGIDGFGAEANGGLIVLPPTPNAGNRAVIRRLAERHRLPAIYQAGQFAVEGGLMACGSNPLYNYQRASYFVDRVLRGAKVADLPLEFPTRFELAINLKAAKAIGLTIPEDLVLLADKVIE